MIEALHIHVKGIVQGVGFRPFVYRMAKKYLINGWVLNAADGVSIHAEGEGKLLDEFVIELSENAPSAAQVAEIDLAEVPLEFFDSFEIRFSDEAAVERTTLVSPDLATCDDCLREMRNPNDRRYHYPFINCTNCGPRFTIIERLPYDRAHTSMAAFEMCPRCAAEYADPADRRFHAQPDACFECGPRISWRLDGACNTEVTWGNTLEESDAIIEAAAELLACGGIVAVKGLGGYHLACDANSAEAVARLRVRKRREGKAFAVMVADADDAARLCELDAVERKVLESPQRPIVLLKKGAGARLVPDLTSGLSELGVMLPCTPVQHLLIEAFAKRAAGSKLDGTALASNPPMLVMTSGNLHDEPICTSDEEAYASLGGVADAFLGNDRPILTRFDDSVVRVVDAGEGARAVQFIRRARGYAPAPLELAGVSEDGMPVVFATGPEQKNTFALLRGNEAFVSQHIGDMENAETYEAWLAAKARYEKLFEAEPVLVACDMHPEYLTSKWAHDQALPVFEVQHHHAHVVSVMAEHGLTDAVCGIAFDGTGYGVDGCIWGGEALLANRSAFERFANFAYVPMPGGAAAIKNPLRMAYGVLWAFDLLEHPAAASVVERLGNQAQLCDAMIEQGINTPQTSSVGRLFDAASAILGVCEQPKYEGEGAMLLEAAMCASFDEPLGLPRCSQSEFRSDENSPMGCSPKRGLSERLSFSANRGADAQVDFDEDPAARERYAVAVTKNTATETSTAQDTSVVLLDAAPTFEALLDDMAAGVPVPVIARRFHDAFVDAILMVAELVRGLYGIDVVALAGGVFMNRYLTERAIDALSAAGFTAAVNRDLPPNDGSISLGQAVVAWAKLETGE